MASNPVDKANQALRSSVSNHAIQRVMVATLDGLIVDVLDVLHKDLWDEVAYNFSDDEWVLGCKTKGSYSMFHESISKSGSYHWTDLLDWS